ncbi:hypothetical protein PVAP13_8NG319484 [Panicum virgatum]|uniref:Secreted protein n=1 Tax=Panicum virgatum TaxID=38727 RepID=A0A8T0PFY5_PANVG|nr:hypothetical protein PVAP13_8NG319484 [Panicum virgatum]
MPCFFEACSPCIVLRRALRPSHFLSSLSSLLLFCGMAQTSSGATDSDRGRCEQMDGRREKRRRELKDKAWRLGEDPDAWCWYGHVGHVMWTASEILLLDLQLQPQHR